MKQIFFSILFCVVVLDTGYFQASWPCAEVVGVSSFDREYKIRAEFAAVSATLKQNYQIDQLSFAVDNLLMPDTPDGFGKTYRRALKLAIELLYLESKRLVAASNDSVAQEIFERQRNAVHIIYDLHSDRGVSDASKILKERKALAYFEAYQEGVRFKEVIKSKKS